MILEGKLPAFKIGKDWRIKATDLTLWMEKKEKRSIKPALEEVSEFKQDDPQKLWTGGTAMKVKKVALNRWFAGFGGFFWKLDSKGLRRWYIWIYDGNGKRIHKAVELVTNEKEAMVAIKYELEQMRKRAFTLKYFPEKAEELGIDGNNNGSIKMEKMLRDWLELYAKANRKNHNSDKSVVKYWVERFGKKKANELTQADIMRLFAKEVNKAMEEGKDKYQIEKIKNSQRLRGQVLKAAYNWAKKMRFGVKENPVEGTLPRIKKREKEPFTAEEREMLFGKAAESYPWMVPVQHFASVYGSRIGEIENLNWPEVDFVKGEIKILDPKEGESKTLVFDSNCYIYEVLLELKKAHDKLDKRDFKKGDEAAVFIYLNPRFNKWSCIPIRSQWIVIMEMAGLKGKGKTFHSWRHTAGSLGVDAGVNPKAIQRMYGHHSLEMTAHYLHADKEAQVNAVKTIENQLNIRKLNGKPLSLQR